MTAGRGLRLILAGGAAIAALCLCMTGQTTNGQATSTPASAEAKNTMSDTQASATRHLQAGPIQLEFANGELRYIRVGDREIVRRVYFAVRDSNWGTAQPKFDLVKVDAFNGEFKIELSATCKNDLADYSWKGGIIGTTDGTIHFSVSGNTNADFSSPRVGLCVLFGTPELVGTEFQAFGAFGQAPQSGKFPELINPKLLAGKFGTLSFALADKTQVTCRLESGLFDMEDQRNYGDSSFKAYAPLDYKYPNLTKGQSSAQMFSISVKGAAEPTTFPTTAPAAGPVRVTLDKAIDAKMPKLVPATDAMKMTCFIALGSKADKLKDSKTLTWGFCPFWHLFDDDVLFENVPAVGDQLRSARAIAPKAVLQVAPITMTSPYSGSPRDERNAKPIAAAWSAAMVRELALGGADEAAFDVGPAFAKVVLDDLAAHAGQSLFEAASVGGPRRSVLALAVKDTAGRTVWLINTSDQPQDVVVNLDAAKTKTACASEKGFDVKPDTSKAQTKPGEMALKLKPYEVCRLTLAD